MLEGHIAYLNGPFDPTEVHYIGWGGKPRAVKAADMDMGVGVFRTPPYGIRRAIWDASFGYVSGFRKRDILYYVLTRSFSSRVAEAVIRWESRNA